MKNFDLSLKIGARNVRLKSNHLYQAVNEYDSLFKTKSGLIKNKFLEKRNYQ